MKKLLVLMYVSFSVTHCAAQTGKRMNIDLEKLTFRENAKELIQERRRSADHVEGYTTLPAYTVYDAKGYKFGPVTLEDQCSTSFVLNSVKDKKMVGLVIQFGTEATSKAVGKYFFQKYPRSPIVLEKQVKQLDNNNKYRLSSSAYLWRNVRPGVSMILGKGYNSVVNGRTIETSTVILIDNTVKGCYEGSFKTVLDRVIATFTTSHDHD